MSRRVFACLPPQEACDGDDENQQSHNGRHNPDQKGKFDIRVTAGGCRWSKTNESVDLPQLLIEWGENGDD